MNLTINIDPKLPPEERAYCFAIAARKLVTEAEKAGICMRIDRQPLQPLAMGHARHTVETWVARHQASIEAHEAQ